MLDNVVCDMLSVFDAFVEAEAQSQASAAAAATSAQSTQDDSKTSTDDSAASGLNKDGLAHMLRALNVELSAVQLMRVWGLLSSGSERVAWNRIFQAIISGPCCVLWHQNKDFACICLRSVHCNTTLLISVTHFAFRSCSCFVLLLIHRIPSCAHRHIICIRRRARAIKGTRCVYTGRREHA